METMDREYLRLDIAKTVLGAILNGVRFGALDTEGIVDLALGFADELLTQWEESHGEAA